MTAWQILIAGSSAVSSAIAWIHLNSQKLGSGTELTIYGETLVELEPELYVIIDPPELVALEPDLYVVMEEDSGITTLETDLNVEL